MGYSPPSAVTALGADVTTSMRGVADWEWAGGRRGGGVNRVVSSKMIIHEVMCFVYGCLYNILTFNLGQRHPAVIILEVVGIKISGYLLYA